MDEHVVNFRIDKDAEMLVVEINGEVWMEGNFWDFDFVSDVPRLLDKLGVENYEEDWVYECWEDEDE